MYRLKLLNTVREVETEFERDRLIDQGYKLDESKPETPAEGESTGDGSNIEGAGSGLEKMSPEELKAYAEENKIDIGQATTAKGMLKKILEAQSK